MNLGNTYTSGIFILLLLIVIGILFRKLRHVNWYSTSIYIFLAAFWLVMIFIRVSIPVNSHNGLPTWAWPIIIASYQFIQVFTRIPLGKLSAKLKSRKTPILIAMFLVLIGGTSMVSTDFSIASVVIATLFTGVFGATYGMQNQYWAENYNKKAVFISVALITILPSIGALFATFIKGVTNWAPGSTQIKWFIVGLLIFLFIVMIMNLFFKEKKKTIRLSKTNEFNEKLAKLKVAHVLKLSISVAFVSISYNMVNTNSGSQQDMISSKTTFESTIITIVAIVVALITALYLIRKIKSHNLVIIGHIIQLVGFILGFIYAFCVRSFPLKFTYLIVMAIGFTLYQNTLVGVTLHFDLKNSLMVMGIWLTCRSASVGIGQVIGKEVFAYSPSMIKWLLIPASIMTFGSLAYTIYRHKITYKVVFDVVDHYEARAPRHIWY